MAKRAGRSLHGYEQLPRFSDDAHRFDDLRPTSPARSWLHRLRRAFPRVHALSDPAVYTRYVTPRRRRRSVLRLVYWSIFSVPYILALLVLIAAVFFPSYTVRPVHYTELRRRALQYTTPGRANPYNEKVFIVAALSEDQGHLTSGSWATSVLQLIDLLGPDNVHLSVYENNADPETQQSLTAFRRKVPCNSTIVFEDLDLSTLPHVTLPSGEARLKRITFLADVRNRALAPIDAHGVTFDKILYLNDISFNPIEAAQLLFATNVDSTGRADYSAACAVDFIMPFKFYDRFATRDLDGYITGLPFFPWFTSAGTGTSRREVMAGKDAVRVRSCWGGMVAFQARWFQAQSPAQAQPHTPTSPSQLQPSQATHSPLRFRAESDVFWESSECCLIHADLQYRQSGVGMPPDSAIYLNPFVRVAYDETTLAWLSIIRRPERLYSLIHDILNYFVGFPEMQSRLGEEPGSVVIDTVWQYDDPAKGLLWTATQEDLRGHYVNVTRVVEPGSFCGSRNLLVINEKPEHGPGQWGKIWPPHAPGTI